MVAEAKKGCDKKPEKGYSDAQIFSKAMPFNNVF